MKKKTLKLLGIIMLIILLSNNLYAQFWSANSLSCTAQRGIQCIGSVKVNASFNLDVFDNVVTSGTFVQIQQTVINNQLDVALGTRANQDIWVKILKGLKDGTFSVQKTNGVSGYDYMIGKIGVYGKYNRQRLESFIAHVTFVK